MITKWATCTLCSTYLTNCEILEYMSENIIGNVVKVSLSKLGTDVIRADILYTPDNQTRNSFEFWVYDLQNNYTLENIELNPNGFATIGLEGETTGIFITK